MDDKVDITDSEFMALCAEMDRLCDNNDLDGIISLCKTFEGKTHRSAITRMYIFYNTATGYNRAAALTGRRFDNSYTGLATLNFRKAIAEASQVEKNRYKSEYNSELDSYIQTYTPSEIISFDDLNGRLKTNFANELSSQGRQLEAIAIYDEAICLGNAYAVLGKAKCLYDLAESVYSEEQEFYIYREAVVHYHNALSRIGEFAQCHREMIQNNKHRDSFLSWFQEKEASEGMEFPSLESLPPTTYGNRKEKDYFRWCAVKRLFLNELNSISSTSAVEQDVLDLADFSSRINTLLSHSEALSFHGHFDGIKTDYCYARYLAYMGCSIPLFEEHFFNSTFDQVDTLDYQINNLKANHLKSCFRISYSIFDKIAFFLHRFFELDDIENDRDVDFKKLWVKPRPHSKELKDIFNSCDNMYFRALYFLSREIRQVGNDKTPKESDLAYWFDPDTERLFKIRNAIEHRSFKLVDGVCYRMSHDSPLQLHYEEIHQKELRDANEELRSLKMTSNSLDDDGRTLAIHLVEKHIAELNADLGEKRRMSSYSLTVGIEEFERLTIKLLTLAKDATIYLSLAVYHEERKKPRQPKEILLPRVVPRKNDWL